MSRPSSLACVPCRRRHLKCDARMPVCSRCLSSNIDCGYVRSRRGLRGNNAAQPIEEGLPLFGGDNSLTDWLNATALPTDLDPGTNFLDSPHTLIDLPSLPDDPLWAPQALTNYDHNSQNNTNNNDRNNDRDESDEIAYDPMIQLYYQNFHPSHPILLPRKALHTPLRRHLPHYLVSLTRYIGAHFYPHSAFQEAYVRAADAARVAPDTDGPFKVQALLLLAIVDHAHGAEDRALLSLHEAISLALEIGMHRASFANAHSRDSSLLAESWRRTYWELFVVDGLLAAMRDQAPFRLYTQPADAGIPCQEIVYNGVQDMQLQHLPPPVHDFYTSSYAARIDAVRTLGRVLEVNRSLEMDLEEQVECVDAALSSLLMHLPSCTSYDTSPEVDEMLFQAKMITYLSQIYLHHPRSTLRFASFQQARSASSSCTRFKTLTPAEAGGAFLRAADHLSNLATLPSAITRRTPFFTCALAMCVVVHTAAFLVVGSGSGAGGAGGQEAATATAKRDVLRARVQLGFGGLNVLGRVWPLAKTVRRQMVEMGREVGL
ncbi:Zn(II)2Cys6 transcription factor [Aspergillus candidus]|uniref:Zn(2)-C6 fungal-type domain-containing protein n=1 Tax=Aspergillus candidus TaxID=41067 RepID=A0A2I2F8I4_ASPCN|nr:hypothetical protein BDW47DRAFT_132526 [Aspergillus candidus]PLB36937.1 hypothetical protein BDW47DRAFT_132526 [Aspergillus candidus]